MIINLVAKSMMRRNFRIMMINSIEKIRGILTNMMKNKRAMEEMIFSLRGNREMLSVRYD